MVQRSDDSDLRLFLDVLPSREPITEDDGKVVRFGPWTCYLANESFVLFAAAADDSGFIQWSGDFVRQADGKWVAKVTEKTQT
jgi:hypothetical protein